MNILRMAKSASPSRSKYYLFGFLVLTLVLGGVLFALVSQRGLSQENRGQAATCSEAPVDTQFRMYVAGQNNPWVGGAGFAPKVGESIDVNCFAKNGSALLSQAKITATVTPPGGSTKTYPIPAASNKGAYLTNLKLTEAGTYKFTCANTSNTCTNTDEFTVAGTAAALPSPTLQMSCQNSKIAGTATWTSGAAITELQIDDDNNWTNGYWKKTLGSGAVTSSFPDGFTPSGRSGTLEIKANTQYWLRLASSSAFSETSTFTSNACNTTGSGAATGISDLNKNGKADPDDYRLFLEDFRKRLAL